MNIAIAYSHKIYLLCDCREVGTDSTFLLAILLSIVPPRKRVGKREITKRSVLVPTIWAGFRMFWGRLYWQSYRRKSHESSVCIDIPVWTIDSLGLDDLVKSGYPPAIRVKTVMFVRRAHINDDKMDIYR